MSQLHEKEAVLLQRITERDRLGVLLFPQLEEQARTRQALAERRSDEFLEKGYLGLPAEGPKWKGVFPRFDDLSPPSGSSLAQ